jgi:bifunctional N-acetylglucosamine-1-phosphate-uridyltransferase/glucosamine-1-phosphate-acetyltransferase GlmU-like protein
MKKQKDIIGIALAGGKGTRFKSNGINKTVSLYKNKPLIQYGLDLYKRVCSQSVIVVGAYSESVINAISHNDNLIFAFQRKRLGTGHALMIAIKEIEKNKLKPRLILLGYGDHMMHYTDEVVDGLVKAHNDTNTVISLVGTHHEDPSSLAWSRIIRNKAGNVLKIVEQKDATDIEKKVTELNAGFYCFNYEFLKKTAKQVKKSPVTGEYYLTTFIELAIEQGKHVQVYNTDFERVGLGINTREDLEKSQFQYTISTLEVI